MAQLMKVNELYELVLGVVAHKKNNAMFFLEMGAQKAVLCSFFFIMFINFDMRSEIGQLLARSDIHTRYLMNIMKVYEVGEFNGFFWMCGLIYELGKTRYFIKVH